MGRDGTGRERQPGDLAQVLRLVKLLAVRGHPHRAGLRQRHSVMRRIKKVMLELDGHNVSQKRGG